MSSDSKYYAICELDKDGNINHVYCDCMDTDYDFIKQSYHNVKFNCTDGSYISFYEANNRYKNKYGYYKYGIKEIDMNKINLNKFPNYER